jgi:hypothetical protein
MSEPLRKRVALTLMYLAERVLMGKRTVAMNDMEYGLRMANRAAVNPMSCACMNCIMGKDACLYEPEYEYYEAAQAEPLDH